MAKRPDSRIIDVVTDESEVVSKLCKIIEEASVRSVKERGSFKIAVSGGSLVGMLAVGLPKIKTSWDNWIIFFCDERLVPAGNKESTFGIYKQTVIATTPLEEKQFVHIDFSFTDNPELRVGEAAADYERKMRQHFPECSSSSSAYPALDCVLLGMGEDGHTCSLFPEDSKTLSVKNSWVVPVKNSPKPPSCRITLTLPVLNAASTVIFPIAGPAKARTIQAVFSEGSTLPASLVKPSNGTVYWLLDGAAASLLIHTTSV